jgi:cytochrome c5
MTSTRTFLPGARRGRLWLTAAVLLGAAALAASGLSRADDDEDNEHGHRGRAPQTAQMVKSPGYKLYQQECAGCHLAYPPGMLPPASWQRIMGSLDKHYGANAALDAPTVRELGAWLATQAQATSSRRTTEAPPQDRITRSAWFVHEHDEIGARVWQRPSIKSPANCMACHAQRADGQPNFSEHAVRIPKQ